MLRLARRIAVLILTLLFIPFALSNRQHPGHRFTTVAQSL